VLSASPLADDDANLAQNHDDLNLLFSLCASIGSHSLEDSDATEKYSLSLKWTEVVVLTCVLCRTSGGLISNIKTSAGSVPSRISQTTDNVGGLLFQASENAVTIESTRLAQDSVVLGVKCTMLAYGVMETSKLSSDEEVKARLSSAVVWEMIKRLFIPQ
jgi:hypothetical protein